MTRGQLKLGYFVLEGLNAAGVSYYAFYVYFHLQRQFGFRDVENLGVAALGGLIYMVSAAWAGRFAQRRGYFLAARLGLGIMVVALGLGYAFPTVVGQVTAFGFYTLGMSFTWPVFEALVSEGESPTGLQRMIGVYNLVWAGCGAGAYFVGGAMLERLGWSSLFMLPALVHMVQVGLASWLETRAARMPSEGVSGSGGAEWDLHLSPRPISGGKVFLKLAWVANPFAFVAINTVVAVIPSLAGRFGLTPAWAGVFCSTWMFARLGSFLVLWQWKGWHYRFGWFLGAYFMMLASFGTILMVGHLGVVVAAQVVFGGATGLLYYSSLYYSMDVGETKGEHGGIHEAAIGAGIFAGPAVGAVGLWWFPQVPASGVIAVSGLLLGGLGVLLAMRRGQWTK